MIGPYSGTDGKAFVVTGFGPFGSVCENPTEKMIEELGNRFLHRRLAYAGPRLVTAVFDPAVRPLGLPFWVKSLWDFYGAEAVAFFHFGTDSRSNCISVERRAVNLYVENADGESEKQYAIYRDGPASLQSAVHSGWLSAGPEQQQFATGLENFCGDRRIHVTDSEDAGTYLCNMMLYSSLYEANRRKMTGKAVGFVHVPNWIQPECLAVYVKRLLDEGLRRTTGRGMRCREEWHVKERTGRRSLSAYKPAVRETRTDVSFG